MRKPGVTAILINGIDFMNKSHELVKACPLELRWGRTDRLSGLVPLSRSVHSEIIASHKISTQIDDISGDDLFTVGELTLCVRVKPKVAPKVEVKETPKEEPKEEPKIEVKKEPVVKQEPTIEVKPKARPKMFVAQKSKIRRSK